MKVETLLFSSGVLFFAPIAVIYGIVTQWQEPVGVAALFLTAGLSLLVGAVPGAHVAADRRPARGRPER